MAKVEERSMRGGRIPMKKKWNNMGVPRSKVSGKRGETVDTAVKRDTIKR
jgi:hypothetical protein